MNLPLVRWFSRPLARFLRGSFTDRVRLWAEVLHRACSGLPHPGKKRPSRPSVRLSIDVLETRWVPQDMLSIIRPVVNSVGFSVVGTWMLGHDPAFPNVPDVTPSPNGGGSGEIRSAFASNSIPDEALAFFSSPSASRQNEAVDAVWMPRQSTTEPVQHVSEDAAWDNFLQRAGNAVLGPPPPATPAGVEPPSNSGGGEGPSSVGSGLNTNTPAAPMPSGSRNVPDASSAGAMLQAAAARSSAGATLGAVQPTSGTAGTGGAKGGMPLAAGGGDGGSQGGSGSDGGGSDGGSSGNSGPSSAALAASYGQLELPFELNAGQSDPSVVALSNGPGFGFWLTNDNTMVFRLPPQQGGTEVFSLQMDGGNSQPAILPGNQLITRANYFLAGQGDSGGVTDVAQYSSLTDQGVYPNTDLVLHSASTTDRTFEFDYVLNPGASLSAINLTTQGLQGVSLDQQGNLLMATPAGNVVMNAPVFYQTIDGQKQYVAGNYVLNDDGSIGFAVTGKYDPTVALVLDPALSYSSYVGGSGDDAAYGVAVDDEGCVYLTGGTTSTDLPASTGYSSSLTGTEDVFVSKLTPDGSAVVYTTYLGGTSGQAAHSIAVNAAGEVAIAGVTTSSDFPTTSGAYESSFIGSSQDAFVAKFNGTGDYLEWASYLGDVDSADGVAMDPSGAVYVTGVVQPLNSYPTTAGAYDTSFGSSTSDAFVAKFDATGDTLEYSTFLGSTGSQGTVNSPYNGPSGGSAYVGQGGIAVDGAGDVFVTGQTTSSSFPRTAGTFSGPTAAFITEVNPAGSALVYSYVVSGSGTTEGHAIALDTSGQAFITGETGSSALPVTAGVYQSSKSGMTDAFVLGVNAAGSALVYCTYLGSTGSFSNTYGYGIAVDTQDRVAITGETSNSGFPTTSNAFQTSVYGSTAGFVTQFTPTGTLSYSSYLGSTSSMDFMSMTLGIGLAEDPRGDAYIAGASNSSALVVTSGSYSGTNAGGYDAFTAKIILNRPAPPVITAISPDTGSSSSDFITDSQNLTLSGTGTPGTTVTLERADVGVLGSVPVSMGGTWSYDYTGTTLNEGTYDIAVTQTDSTGATSDLSSEQEVTVDLTAPTVTASILDTGGASSLTSLSPTILVTASDPVGIPSGATVDIDVDLLDDGSFTDPGDTDYATGTLVDGQAIIQLPQLPGTGDFPMRARIINTGGTGGISPTLLLPPINLFSWSGSATVLDADPTEGIWDAQLGDVSVSHALDLDRSPGTSQGGDPALVYHSSTVNPQPLVDVTLRSPNNASLPGSISARLTFDGVAGATMTYSTTGKTPGQVFTLALESATTINTTGKYSYSVSVTAGTWSTTLTGNAIVVVETTSPFGAGWTLAGVDQLVPISGGVVYVWGSGGFRFFAGSGGSYTTPNGDNGTLTLTGATYTYSTPDGESRTFNSSGDMTAWTSPDGHETLQYRYDVSNRLIGITAIDGALTTITYNYTAGVVNQVLFQTVNSRVTTLTLDPYLVSGATYLQTISDPGSGVQSFTYDANDHLTEQQFGVTEDNWAYSSAGVLGTYTWGALTSGGVNNLSRYVYQPANAQGFTALAVDPVFATITDPLGHVTQYQMDNDARPLREVAADGGVTTFSYNPWDFLSEVTDPLGHTTAYGRDSSEYVSLETLPDGSLITYQYQSAFHALTTMIDDRGGTTTYAYDAQGHLTGTTDPLGNHTTYGYLSNGLLQTVTDANNQTTSYSYDADRRLSTTTDPTGATVTYSYDANGNLSTMQVPIDGTTTYAFDALGRLTNTTNPLGGQTAATYDASGLELTSTDQMGAEASYSYDSFGRGLVAKEVDFAGALATNTLYTYDNAGNLVNTRDSDGWVATYAYDPVGRQTSVIDPLGNRTTTTYNVGGEVVRTTDAMGNATQYGYNTRGWVDQVTDALGDETHLYYDAAGNLTEVMDQLTHITSYAYDADNQQTVAHDPLGHLVTTSYDPVGNISTVTDANGVTTSYTYDGDNRETSQTNAVGTMVQQTTTMTYNLAGNMTAYTDGLGNTFTYSYDALDRVTSVLDPDFHRTTYGYDAVGDLTKVTDALSDTTTYTYDALHREIAVTDALGDTTNYTLDADGNRDGVIDGMGDFTQYGFDQNNDNYEVIDPRGQLTYEVLFPTEQVHEVHDPDKNITTYTLDQLDRVTKTTTPLGSNSVYYDAASRVTDTVDADGRLIHYSYDNADRLTGEVWKNNSGVTVNVVTYSYDNNSNRTSAADYNGTVAYSYDALNRVQSYTNVYSQVLTYSYDANDHVTLRTDSLGGTLTYVYDNVARLTSEQYSGTSMTGTAVYIDFGHNSRNDQTSIHTYGAAGGGVISNYGYDAADRLGTIVNSVYLGATLSYYTYTYDHADRVVNQTHWSQIGTFTYSGTNTYTYDKASQLLTDGTATLSYDANGNRNMSGYQTSSDNRLTNDGTWTYTCDNVGNLVEKTRATGQTWTYSYDDANELTGITETSSGIVELRATYTYDVTGERVQEQLFIYGYSTTTTRYAYDGGTLWAEMDGSNNLENRYIYEARTGLILASISPSSGGGNVLVYFTDARGSVRDLASLSGVVQGQFDYSGYGVITLTAGSASSIIGYDGYVTDVAVGLDFTRNRVYNPSTGTWLTQDPIGFAGGQANLYQYVRNDPTNTADPSGLRPIELGQLYGFGILLFTPSCGSGCCGSCGSKDDLNGVVVPPGTRIEPGGPNDVPSQLKGTWEVSICVSGDHAWIEYYNPQTGERHTAGKYKNGYGGARDDEGNWLVPPVAVSGVQWDREIIGNRKPTEKRTVTITDPIIDSDFGYGFYGNNCTTYARDAWYKYSGEWFFLGALWDSPWYLLSGVSQRNNLNDLGDWPGEPLPPG